MIEMSNWLFYENWPQNSGDCEFVCFDLYIFGPLLFFRALRALTVIVPLRLSLSLNPGDLQPISVPKSNPNETAIPKSQRPTHETPDMSQDVHALVAVNCQWFTCTCGKKLRGRQDFDWHVEQQGAQVGHRSGEGPRESSVLAGTTRKHGSKTQKPQATQPEHSAQHKQHDSVMKRKPGRPVIPGENKR